MPLTESTAVPRYALSFTAGALLAREAVLLAPLYLEHRNWEQVRDLTVERNLLQARTQSSGARLIRETLQRLRALTDRELALLVEATASERGYLLWAAACRRYEFIGEFAEEVLRERFVLLAPTLGYEDFDSFVRLKTLWHEELAELSPATLEKLRATLFRMMREAGLLSKDGDIIPAVLSDRLTEGLDSRTPSDLRFFPTRKTGNREGAS